MLVIGLKFKGKHLQPGTIVKVIDIKQHRNEITVEMQNKEGYVWDEDWNLQHTIWGFEEGEYTKIIE